MTGKNFVFNVSIVILILVAILVISNPQFLGGPTGAQTFGSESVSSGTNGEVRSVLQTGGTESSGGAPLGACSAGYVEAGIFTDKYTNIDSSTTYYKYQKICVKGTSGTLKTCTGTVASEGNACTPAACDAGQIDVGMVRDLRNFVSFSQFDVTVYRLCVAGIDSGNIVSGGESGSPGPTPATCASGSNSGVLTQIHFDDAGYYRSWRVCIAYTPPPTSSSTTTEPPTTSSSSTTTPPTTSGGTTSSSTTTPPTTSAGTTATTSAPTTTSKPTTTAKPTTTTQPPVTAQAAQQTGTTTTTITAQTTTTSQITEQEALLAIQAANTSIILTQETKNITEAVGLYASAIDAYNSGDYANAQVLALQAQGAIKEYFAPPTTEVPILFVSIGAVVLLLIIVGGFFLLQSRKKPAAGQSTAHPAQENAPAAKIKK